MPDSLSFQNQCLDSLSLTRTTQGIHYISALPQRIGSRAPKFEAQAITDRISQAVLNSGKGRITLSIDSQPPRDAASIAVDILPDGRWRLCLSTAAVILWLEHWVHYPEDALITTLEPEAIDSAITPGVFKSAPALGRLHLAPEVFLQYVYARCHHLGQMRGQDNISPPPGLERPNSFESMDSNLTRQDWALIRSLILLVDHLAMPPSNPRGAWTLGSQLAITTEAWLSSLTGTMHLLPVHQILLQGIERALFTLFRAKLGRRPAKTL